MSCHGPSTLRQRKDTVWIILVFPSSLMESVQNESVDKRCVLLSFARTDAFIFIVYILLPCKEDLGFDIQDYGAYIQTPKGRPASFDVSSLSGISGLSFDSVFLSAVLLFCVVLLLLSFPFSAFGPVSCLLSRKCFKLFFFEIGFFVLPML